MVMSSCLNFLVLVLMLLLLNPWIMFENKKTLGSCLDGVADSLELALKDSLKGMSFDNLDELILRIYYLYKHSPKTQQQLKELAEIYSRLQHMRCVFACACLCTCLKHWRHAKKSTPCLIKKASRCAANSTSKTAKFIIFPFLSNTKILGENHVYLFVILLVQW